MLLLENLRFHAEEEKNDPAFAATLASYADSTSTTPSARRIARTLPPSGSPSSCPPYAGLLMEREIEMLSELLESPERPFAAILGGAKVSDKIKVIDTPADQVDMLVLGGGMANTFLLAQGNAIGKSLAEPDRVAGRPRGLSRPPEANTRPGRPPGRRDRRQGSDPRHRIQDPSAEKIAGVLADRRPGEGAART